MNNLDRLSMKKEQILQIINYCEFKKRIIYCKMIEYFVKLVGTVIISNGWLITELLLQEVHFTTFFYSTVAINEFRKTAHVLRTSSLSLCRPTWHIYLMHTCIHLSTCMQ